MLDVDNMIELPGKPTPYAYALAAVQRKNWRLYCINIKVSAWLRNCCACQLNVRIRNEVLNVRNTVARVRRYGAQRFDSRKIDACVGQSLTGGLCRSIRAGVRTRVVRTTAVKRDWGAKCMWVCVLCAVFLLFVLGSSCSHWPTGYRPTINNINVECVCEFAHEAYRNRVEHPRSDLHAFLLILLVSV